MVTRGCFEGGLGKEKEASDAATEQVVLKEERKKEPALTEVVKSQTGQGFPHKSCFPTLGGMCR